MLALGFTEDTLKFLLILSGSTTVPTVIFSDGTSSATLHTASAPVFEFESSRACTLYVVYNPTRL